MKLFTFLLFALLCSSNTNAQEMTFPQSFKSTANIWKGLRLAPINKKLVKEGFTTNPLVTSDKNTIRRFAKREGTTNITALYLELYTSSSNDFDDAGVTVFQYNNKEELSKALPFCFAQGNLSYLTLDNYLIEIWSDVSKGSEPILKAATNFYKIKLGAKIYEAKEDASIIDAAQSVEETEAAPTKQ